MESPDQEHKFNDDLLLAPKDRQFAARKYPTIFHVLDHPELRQLFSRYDQPANAAKSTGRWFGLGAIGLVFIALLIASTEHPHELPADALSFFERLRYPQTIWALISAVCGIAGGLMGGLGALYARRKRRWLHHRLMTERIRQFHFQTFIFRVREILQSLQSEDAKADFASSRNGWLEIFKMQFVGKLDSEFSKMISENGAEMALHEDRKRAPAIPETPELDPLFKAYRELRIEHQIGYVNYNLTPDGRIFSSIPRSQAEVLANFGFLCIVGLCAVHILVLLVVLVPSDLGKYGWLFPIAAIWIALAALAGRAIEQGLQPEREVERYQQYGSGLRAVRDRFDRAQTPAEKLQIMIEMEQLAFDEIRNFLITNDRSRFVM
jgi:hypothetical protein